MVILFTTCTNLCLNVSIIFDYWRNSKVNPITVYVIVGGKAKRTISSSLCCKSDPLRPNYRVAWANIWIDQAPSPKAFLLPSLFDVLPGRKCLKFSRKNKYFPNAHYIHENIPSHSRLFLRHPKRLKKHRYPRDRAKYSPIFLNILVCYMSV